MDDLKRKKLQKSQDARDWTAVEALEETLEEIRNDEAQEHRIIVIWWTNVGTKDSPIWEKNQRRAEVTYSDIPALLTMALHDHLNEWGE